MRNPFRTISAKLIATTTASITLVLICGAAIVAQITSDRVRERVLNTASRQAVETSNAIIAEMTEATSAAATLSGVLTGYLENGNAQAGEIINILRGVPERYDLVYASWMMGIAEGPTDNFVTGPEGRNSIGTFSPFWTKNDQGGVTLETIELAVDAQDEWFRLPIVRGNSVISEPYLFDGGRLLTSVSVPLIVKGETVAVTGVDIVLDTLVSFLQGIQTFEGGRIMLLDEGGKWLAHEDRDLITQPFEGVGTDAFQTALATNELQIVDGLPDGATRMIYPFTGYGMDKTWALVVDVPRELFIAPVRESLLQVLAASAVFLAMTLASIFFASRALVRRPLHKMLQAVTALSDGKVHDPIALPQSRDETGEMAISIETLREGLAKKETLETEQKQESERQAVVVETLAQALRSLAQGRLNSHLPDPLPGQYEALRVDFNNTVTRLSEVIGAIDGSSRTIGDGVAGITSASNDLSQRTETSAAQLEETAASLTEMTGTVKSVAQDAQDAKELVASMKSRAASSSEVVNDTVQAMDAIKSSSEQISKITSVIDDIAFQPNLLALNAGVEAARAGSAGQGFSVVAAEVRGLAQRSSEAAQEIKTLILSSGNHVSHGVDLVGRTSDALQSIIGSVEALSENVGSITSQIHEQSDRIGEINSAMSTLDSTQQQNAAMYEETAAACIELDAETNGLTKLVASFNHSDQPATEDTSRWAAE
jgi:methyl-accepting chemotaxis protein